MSSINSTYNFELSSLVTYFERGLQPLINKATLSLFGSQWDSIDAEIKRLPVHVDAANANAVKGQLEKIITELRTTVVAAGNPAFRAELDTLQNILDTGGNHPASPAQKVITCSNKLFAYLWSFVQAPRPPAPNVVGNVATAFNRLKADLTNLTPAQKNTLLRHAKVSEEASDFRAKFTYEIKAHTYNIATILAIRAIVLFALGMVGFKMMLVTATAFYLLRAVADKSMSLTSYDSWIKMPVIIPLGIPYAPITSYLIPGINLPIPTLKGIGQLAARVHNYINFYLTNANESTLWKPNFLEFNGVVILKNGIIPLSEYPAAFKRALS